jgi:hypothetical protein
MDPEPVVGGTAVILKEIRRRDLQAVGVREMLSR